MIHYTKRMNAKYSQFVVYSLFSTCVSWFNVHTCRCHELCMPNAFTLCWSFLLFELITLRYSSHGRSPPRQQSRSPIRGRSRSPVLHRSINPVRAASRSRSRSPIPRRAKLLGRTPPLPPPSPVRQYSRDRSMSADRRSPNRDMSLSAYGRSGVPAAYRSPSPRPAGTSYTSQYRSSGQRWSRSASISYSPGCSKHKGQPSTPPAAYRLQGSLQRSVSRSGSSSSSQISRNHHSRSRSCRRSRSISNGGNGSQRYSKDENRSRSKMLPSKWIASSPGGQCRSPSRGSRNGKMRSSNRRH